MAGSKQAITTVLDTSDETGLRLASDLLRQRRRTSEPVHRSTGLATLDALLDGGPVRGSLTEIVGRPSSGRFAVLLSTIRHLTASGEPAALIDQGAHLEPRSAAAIGIDLERLLWVRPRRLPETLAAAEWLLATGFPLVAIDLGLPPVKGRASLAAWIRLARCTTEYQAVTLIGTPYRISGCAAHTVVVAGSRGGRWSGRAGALRMLEGTHGTLHLAKDRDHHARRRTRLKLTLPEAAFGPATTHDPSADDGMAEKEFTCPVSMKPSTKSL